MRRLGAPQANPGLGPLRAYLATVQAVGLLGDRDLHPENFAEDGPMDHHAGAAAAPGADAAHTSAGSSAPFEAA